VDPASVGLSRFGKPSGFYNRQIATFGTISEMQAQAVDVETHVPVGKIPHFDDMVAFFKDGRTQPEDRATLIHGDYKIDNLVFHKTEPRVIGILEYVFAPSPPPPSCSPPAHTFSTPPPLPRIQTPPPPTPPPPPQTKPN